MVGRPTCKPGPWGGVVPPYAADPTQRRLWEVGQQKHRSALAAAKTTIDHRVYERAFQQHQRDVKRLRKLSAPLQQQKPNVTPRHHSVRSPHTTANVSEAAAGASSVKCRRGIPNATLSRALSRARTKPKIDWIETPASSTPAIFHAPSVEDGQHSSSMESAASSTPAVIETFMASFSDALPNLEMNYELSTQGCTASPPLVSSHAASVENAHAQSAFTKASLSNALAPIAPELASFLGAFDCGARDQCDARNKLWHAWDNGNGYLSLAEVDGGILAKLKGTFGDDGDTYWRRFRPSFIHAFNDAKDAARDPPGGVNADDFVTKREFRLLICYLRYYATWFEVFSLVDGYSEGTTETDDRRISQQEWAASVDKVVEAGNDWAPFVALQGATESSFSEIDIDGGGMILLTEFCKWVKKAEIAAETEAGANLAVGDDD